MAPNDPRRSYSIGSVSYLNAKPLLYGLEHDPSVKVHLDVPARLLEGLQSGKFDVALLPVIDFQRADGLRLVPSGGIGSDGQTLTVRIFSRGPIERMTRLGCDPDSHTSVALARILLAELFGIHPEFVPLRPDEDAMLLIGDKVVRDEPRGMPHQLDLGEAWKRLTGMPFVFAVWTARWGNDLGDLPRRLADARLGGMKNVGEIVNLFASKHGWPAELARKYLTEYLQFEIGERELKAISHFHALAAKHGLIITPPRPLETE
ncbi:MAG TPA: menaquinone biosynthesis protein [Candidatus Acidoferrales bacterium]|nr:menaquinone biosynthesis protein [Candidatus Acidoferrales bacterium]